MDYETGYCMDDDYMRVEVFLSTTETAQDIEDVQNIYKRFLDMPTQLLSGAANPPRISGFISGPCFREFVETIKSRPLAPSHEELDHFMRSKNQPQEQLIASNFNQS